MKNNAAEIKEFLLSNVEQNSKNIVNLAMEKFGVTRTTVHRHLNFLIKNGKIEKSGKTNQSVYFLKSSLNKQLTYSIDPKLSESQVWEQEFEKVTSRLPKNIYEICYYGFTEIFNNAIDHSEGTTISVSTRVEGDTLTISIADNGIGVFKKIKEAFRLENERESILQLSKGKLTTDKQRHSGEGIFFTSRAFDSFGILANGLFYLRDNTQKDWLVEERKNVDTTSTVIRMKINLHSERVLKEVFMEFQNPETLAFDRTHIFVSLSLSGEEYFVSRSQAKRILLGVEKFNNVTLDFKGIKSVGQAFVDEVFRVFKNKYPNIKIDTVNTNVDIDFMIKRGVETAKMM